MLSVKPKFGKKETMNSKKGREEKKVKKQTNREMEKQKNKLKGNSRKRYIYREQIQTEN